GPGGASPPVDDPWRFSVLRHATAPRIRWCWPPEAVNGGLVRVIPACSDEAKEQKMRKMHKTLLLLPAAVLASVGAVSPGPARAATPAAPVRCTAPGRTPITVVLVH